MTEPAPDTVGRGLVIEAGAADRHYWRDIWAFRELFAVLAWRDIAVRYKQTVIGVAWAVLRPLLTMLVLTFIFGRVADLPSDGAAPYVLMVFAGTLPWYMFSTALSDGANSLVTNANMVRKVYFPRIIAPTSASIVSLVDFLISLVLFFATMAVVGFSPGWQLVLLPVAIIFAVIASLGPILLLSGLTVQYRDMRFITPFIVQFGLYVSPVGFSSAVIPEQYQLLYHLNPMAGVIDLFRYCLLGGQTPLDWPSLGVSFVVALMLLAFGLSVFRKIEKTFADFV